ncbi:MAG: hypothetical protein KC414_15270, partial [Romboutsia sp.]|nr:hypothetical protein [Romboutsia sp.]
MILKGIFSSREFNTEKSQNDLNDSYLQLDFESKSILESLVPTDLECNSKINTDCNSPLNSFEILEYSESNSNIDNDLIKWLSSESEDTFYSETSFESIHSDIGSKIYKKRCSEPDSIIQNYDQNECFKNEHTNDTIQHRNGTTENRNESSSNLRLLNQDSHSLEPDLSILIFSFVSFINLRHLNLSNVNLSDLSSLFFLSNL